ncbi:MAG: bifunctional riboflavin kinase/FAD synthetase [Chlamydiales bacterium]
MKILHEIVPIDGPVALTIGNFDGVHLGHQTLVQRLLATGLDTTLLTFSNHPSEVLFAQPSKQIIATGHKLALLKELGVKTTFLLPFTEQFAEQSPQQFLSTLKKKVDFSHLILGHDAVIGHKREGDAAVLTKLSQELGFSLSYLSPVTVGGIPVSSSQIRILIEEGRFADIIPLLGRPYSIQGRVIQGNGRGKKLGFPTANILLPKMALPRSGVYEVRVGKNRGIANIGIAPTFGEKKEGMLEVHLLDYEKDLYGVLLDVELVRFMREEKKFASAEALTEQIEQDIRNVERA